jgi:predicted PurR-regulated permease PerM
MTVGAASFATQLITVLAVTFLLVLHGREYAELGLSLTSSRRQQRYRQTTWCNRSSVAER